MVHLPGGTFLMGSESRDSWVADGEGPVRPVELKPFWIGECAVTNREFEAFVAATSYVTEAEKFGWSYVFHRQLTARAREAVVGGANTTPWWLGVTGAYWRAPEGPGSTVKKRADHPVVHVSWNDADAYCRWAGMALPTEAQWEYAARGGLVQKAFPWGDELTPGDKNGKPVHRCNIWQGKFPDLDTGADGHTNTAPARSYAANGYGLFNMSGNAWEWCADWFTARHTAEPALEPKGPCHGTLKVMKGGSYLCHASYCNRYRVAARTSNPPDSSSGHLGFRCVLNE